MGRNLGPLNIKDSYEGLVQISGSQLTDGSGSLIPSLDVSASYATSASVADTAGSATTAQSANTINVSDSSINTSFNVALTPTTGNPSLILRDSADEFTFNPSTNRLEVPHIEATTITASFQGDLAGTASFATTASYAENVTTPTLQEVTDAGNTTTNQLQVDNFVLNRGTYVGSNPIVGGPYTKLLGQGIQADNSGEYFQVAGDTTATSKLILSATQISSSFPTEGSTLGSIKIDAATSTIQVTGSLIAPSITGSLNGNADTATSASHAVFADTAGAATDVNALYTASVSDATISFLKGGGGTFPIKINNVENAVSASHAVNADSAISSSYAVTASYAENAGAAFPYTGSAEITGSLGLTGSLSQGDTNSNLGTNTAILSSGHSLISASVVDSSIISSTGSFISQASNYNNVILASEDSSNVSTGAVYNSAIIASENTSFSGTGTYWNVANIATRNSFNNNSRFSAIIGGETNKLQGFYSNVIAGGSNNEMKQATNSTLAGGGANRIGTSTQTDRGFIGGGSGHLINGGDDGAILGGINADITTGHDRVVILGGSGLQSSKSDEVVVEHLSTNGAVVQDVKALAIVANVAELDASLGNMFTLTLQNAVSTELQLINQSAGQTFQVQVTQNATNAGDMTFDSQFEFEGGTAYVPSSGLGAIDILTFTCFAGGNVQCVSAKNFS